MPRIRLALFPRGLHLNNDHTQQPEGSLRKARNAAPFAGGGTLRSAPPNVLQAGTGPTLGRSRTRFNGRFVNRGVSGGVERIERETVANTGTYANLTLPTVPTVTLRSSSQPMLFATAPPTPEKDEYLFLLDTPNTASDNALLKLKDDGTLSHWGIRPPSAADMASITAAVVAQSSKFINTAASDPFDTIANWGGSPPTSADDNGLGAATAISDVATPSIDGAAIKFLIDKNDSAQMTRVFGGNVDLTTFGASASSDEDFIQLYVRVRRPKHIQSLDIAFDTTAAGDFKKDFFSRELTFELVRRKKRKKLIGMGDLIPVKKVKDFLQNNAQKTNDLTFSESHGIQKIPVTKNTWTRITLPKNTFEQSGTPNWATVRAIRITVHANTEGKTAVFFDVMTLNGGAGLHGDYQYTVTYSSEDGTPASAGSRSNPALDDDKGTTTGLRNSVVTTKVANVERQAVLLTIPALTFDAQVSRLEIWRTVGNGAAYFRCGYIAVTGGAVGPTTFTDNAADYYGMNTNAATSVAGNNTSFAVLDPTEELPLDNTTPNDPNFAFQRMADRPHLGRMWWGRNAAATTESGTAQASLGNQGLVYYSPPGRMEAVQGSVYVTSGVTDPVQALIVWNDRLFVFTSGAMFEIVGTDEPFIAQRIEGAPGTLQPWTVAAGPAGLFYLAEDGVYRFNGQYAENFTDMTLMPFFRYRLTTEDLNAPMVSNSRAVSGRNAYYLGTTSNTYTMIFDYESSSWRYIEGASSAGTNSGALYYDPSTGKIFTDSFTAGADNTEIDAQDYPSSGTVSTLTSRTFLWRAGPGRQGILRKLWVDATIMGTGTVTSITPTVQIDGVATALAAFTPGGTGNDTRTVTEYNLNYPGEVFEVDVAASLARNVRINAIEADIYAAEETDTQV